MKNKNIFSAIDGMKPEFVCLPVPKYIPKMKTTYRNTAGCSCFVIRLGFEPKTYGLEGRCSIQLSYRTEYHFF